MKERAVITVLCGAVLMMFISHLARTAGDPRELRGELVSVVERAPEPLPLDVIEFSEAESDALQVSTSR